MVIKDRYQHAKKTPAAQFILFIFSWREYNSLSFDMAIILKDSTLVLFVPICSDNTKIMVSWCMCILVMGRVTCFECALWNNGLLKVSWMWVEQAFSLAFAKFFDVCDDFSKRTLPAMALQNFPNSSHIFQNLKKNEECPTICFTDFGY